MHVWTRIGLATGCLLLSMLTAAEDSLVVQTKNGAVRGISDAGVTVYKGIPFAAPPVGDLRWRPPAPAHAWQALLTANAFKPMCVTTTPAIPGGPMEKVSEDCLYLNIWTPARRTQSKLPVMVWIYGGGLRAGSGSSPVYWGDKLVEKGVITVNLSYRVGSFGFLSHPELSRESGHGASGNYGIMDMIAALRWVQDNISSFGGDPQQVTVFGQSAGSFGVGYLMTSPLARGLFQRAIGQSGADMGSIGDGMMRPSDAEASGVRLADALGAHSLADLRQVPAERILALDSHWPADAAGKVKPGTMAVADGYVFPATMYDTFKAGKQNDVPLLIGYNANEGGYFVPQPLKAAEYAESVRKEYGLLAGRVLDLYPAGTDENAARSQRELVRDNWYGWQMWTWARLQSVTGHAKVYFYNFSYVRDSAAGTPLAALGAAHGFELGDVFAHVDQLPSTATPKDKRMVETISTYWTQFATTGDPNGRGLPEWPAFTEHSQHVMNLGQQIGAAQIAKDELRRLELQDAHATAVRQAYTTKH